MNIGPEYPLLAATRPFDSSLFKTTIDSAIDWTRKDSFKGIGLAVDASIGLRDYLRSPSLGIAGLISSPIDAASAITSLSYLKTPFALSAGLAVTSDYQGTLAGLASVAGVTDTLKSVYGSGLSTIAISSIACPKTTGQSALGLLEGIAATQRITPSYLASAASVFSLESSYSRLGLAPPPEAGITAISSIAALSGGTVNLLHGGIASLSASANAAWNQFEKPPSWVTSASVDWLRKPAFELYAATQVAAAVSLPPSSMPDTDSELEELMSDSITTFENRLVALDPDLLNVYRGGIEAIRQGGSDWQRHSMVSFRELNTHVLHKLAPDNLVMKTAKPQDLHAGRPTRMARLNYIFSEVSGGAITDFYKADMKAAVELFELLNNGTHKLANEATPEQLRYLTGRLVGLLSSMLDAQGH